MAVRSYAAPPTPWSSELAEPTIDQTAYVHSFSNIIGDVEISADVMIAPGTTIRADEGHPFHIGKGTNVQDGVVIHGLEQGRVKGENGEQYSVWIGNSSSITHMALIHGPAYVGNDCFIGFRSTVFNARVGDGSIVMMHCLIQDVEIPPGRYVPSGSIITTQQEADRLPLVKDSDAKFARHVVKINHALRSGYHCAENIVCIAPIRNELKNELQSDPDSSSASPMSTTPSDTRLSPAVLEQVRQLLAQGYRVATEHADERRYRASSWTSGSAITGNREPEVIQGLESAMAEYAGEYVRLIGVDPKVKRRVLEQLIQTPSGTPAGQSRPASLNGTSGASPPVAVNPGAHKHASGSIADQIQQLLTQGYRVGLEFADERRYRTSSWTTGPSLQSSNLSEVLGSVNAALSEHAGEYVRLIGIDPKAKRRVSEVVIQTPTQHATTGSASGHSSHATSGSSSHASVSGSVAEQIQQLLNQGSRIGLEFADERRYRTSSWTTGPSIQSSQFSEVMAVVNSALSEHAGEYVRLLGIDPKAKRRIREVVIQTPAGQVSGSVAQGGGSVASPVASYSAPVAASVTSTSLLNAATRNQVFQLLAQGYKIGTEHADERRYRTSSWQTCSPITATREPEVVAALESCLVDHAGEYVRLLGIDPKAKRRVLELVIQTPKD